MDMYLCMHIRMCVCKQRERENGVWIFSNPFCLAFCFDLHALSLSIYHHQQQQQPKPETNKAMSFKEAVMRKKILGLNQELRSVPFTGGAMRCSHGGFIVLGLIQVDLSLILSIIRLHSHMIPFIHLLMCSFAAQFFFIYYYLLSFIDTPKYVCWLCLSVFFFFGMFFWICFFSNLKDLAGVHIRVSLISTIDGLYFILSMDGSNL
jgi:hypothetical protein